MFPKKIFPFILLFIFMSVSNIQALPRSMEELSAISANLIQTGVVHGQIVSFYRPEMGRMIEADLKLNPDDQVFIVEFPDGPRIYPQSVMVWHQVVNEIVERKSYIVTYCPLTGTLAAYQSSLDGAALYFDAQGQLYGGNSVLIDRNTGSLWLQSIGMAFQGPLFGKGLAKIPVFWTTWEMAKEYFDDETPVLLPPSGSSIAYGRDPYGGYRDEDSYYYNDVLAFPIVNSDLALEYKDPVLGFEFDNYRLAIDIEYIKQEGAVNFFIGLYPLLAVYDDTLGVVRIFDRMVWNEPSLFVINEGELVDISSKTIWDKSTGFALEGSMLGASLDQYYGIYSMWFNWFNLNPETYLIPGPGEVPKDVLHLEPLAE